MKDEWQLHIEYAINKTDVEISPAITLMRDIDLIVGRAAGKVSSSSGYGLGKRDLQFDFPTARKADKAARAVRKLLLRDCNISVIRDY